MDSKTSFLRRHMVRPLWPPEVAFKPASPPRSLGTAGREVGHSQPASSAWSYHWRAVSSSPCMIDSPIFQLSSERTVLGGRDVVPAPYRAYAVRRCARIAANGRQRLRGHLAERNRLSSAAAPPATARASPACGRRRSVATAHFRSAPGRPLDVLHRGALQYQAGAEPARREGRLRAAPAGLGSRPNIIEAGGMVQRDANQDRDGERGRVCG